MNSLKERIEEVSMSCGIPVHQLALETGINLVTLRNLLSGKTPVIQPPHAQSLAHVSGYDEYWILTGEGQPKSTNQSEQESIGKIRLQNISDLIKQRGWSKSEFAMAVNISPSALSQYFSGYRSPGRQFCHAVETALGLVPTSLDYPRMNVPAHLSTVIPESSSSSSEALNPLHKTLIDLLSKVLQFGAISDEKCAEYILHFSRMSDKNKENHALCRSTLAIPPDSLRANNIVPLYIGGKSAGDLKSQLISQFGEQAALNLCQFIIDLKDCQFSQESVDNLINLVLDKNKSPERLTA